MNDEEVIKRRLLIDADGTGDDRRLNILIKTFSKWCASNESPENIDTLRDRMIAQLAQCEFGMKKSGFSAKMMQSELKNYEKISEAIESGIVLAKQQIEQSKENLKVAKNIRKNRMEYDVLAKIIMQQPDRKNTVEKLNSLREELDQLEKERNNLQSKLETRQKDFTVLLRCIQQLQTDVMGQSPPQTDEDTEGELKMDFEDESEKEDGEEEDMLSAEEEEEPK